MVTEQVRRFTTGTPRGLWRTLTDRAVNGCRNTSRTGVIWSSRPAVNRTGPVASTSLAISWPLMNTWATVNGSGRSGPGPGAGEGAARAAGTAPPIRPAVRAPTVRMVRILDKVFPSAVAGKLFPPCSWFDAAGYTRVYQWRVTGR